LWAAVCPDTRQLQAEHSRPRFWIPSRHTRPQCTTIGPHAAGRTRCVRRRQSMRYGIEAVDGASPAGDDSLPHAYAQLITYVGSRAALKWWARFAESSAVLGCGRARRRVGLGHPHGLLRREQVHLHALCAVRPGGASRAQASVAAPWRTTRSYKAAAHYHGPSRSLHRTEIRKDGRRRCEQARNQEPCTRLLMLMTAHPRSSSISRASDTRAPSIGP
jgi:hypothetical protein